MKTINKLILVMTIVLGSFSSANAFDTTFNTGNGELFFDSSQGMVGQSFDMGGGTTMYHNFDTGFSGSSFDTGFGSMSLEVSPGSLNWVQ
tara:strand:+ start:215 stop:484 length:270 start_codon:yes stop_codon:yes gene_type:complete